MKLEDITNELRKVSFRLLEISMTLDTIEKDAKPFTDSVRQFHLLYNNIYQASLIVDDILSDREDTLEEKE